MSWEGYVKNTPSPSLTGFTSPTELGGAVNAPLTSAGNNTYIGMRMFPGPYDPSQCSAVCQATTTYDSEHPADDDTYMPCNFFNSVSSPRRAGHMWDRSDPSSLVRS